MPKHPFDPHPKWRRNFEFTAAYTKKVPTYILDPIIEHKQLNVEFKLDPIIEHFTLCADSTKS